MAVYHYVYKVRQQLSQYRKSRHHLDDKKTVLFGEEKSGADGRPKESSSSEKAEKIEGERCEERAEEREETASEGGISGEVTTDTVSFVANSRCRCDVTA